MDRHFEILCVCSYRYLLTTALATTLYMSKGCNYGICKGAWSSSGLQYLAYSKVVTLAQITQCNFICNSTNNSYFDYVGLTTEEIQQCFWRGMKSTSIHFVITCYCLETSCKLSSNSFAECRSCDDQYSKPWCVCARARAQSPFTVSQ